MAPAEGHQQLTPGRMDLTKLRIGYAPCDPTLRRPGDRRRFVFYAERRGLQFEISKPGRKYDLVVLSARADITAWARLPRGGPKIVYELIDSYLEVPRFQAKNVLRGPAKFVTRETSRLALSYRRAIEDMCRRADAVVCSTPEQRTSISALNQNTHAILDFHGHLIRTHKRRYSIGERLNLVWEGQPENLGSLELVAPALAELRQELKISLHLITDLQYFRILGRYWALETERRVRALFADTYLYQWNEVMLAPIATNCDIGIIPLPDDDPLMRAKPENKLLLLWRMGIPTVVSDTPAYTRTMAACNLNMTCHSSSDWVATLRHLATDESIRRRAARVGRIYSEDEHGEQQLLARWDAMFASIA